MIPRRRTKRSLIFCGLESLESRQLMSVSALAKATPSFIYTETDNSNPGQNAVIAFRNNGHGKVTQIGSFKTNGTGLANPQGLLGPDDSDKEVIASPDGRLLFAVNQGSNSVAVFAVKPNGALKLVNNQAVSSGGTEPVSLSIGWQPALRRQSRRRNPGPNRLDRSLHHGLQHPAQRQSHAGLLGHDDTAGRTFPLTVADLFDVAPCLSRHLHAASAEQCDKRK